MAPDTALAPSVVKLPYGTLQLLPSPVVRLKVSEKRALPAAALLPVFHESAVEWLTAPLAPVTVMVYVPDEAPPWLRLSVELAEVDPETVTLVGLRVALAPAGTPETERLTVPLNPQFGVTVTVLEVDAPEMLEGEALTPKSGEHGLVVEYSSGVW